MPGDFTQFSKVFEVKYFCITVIFVEKVCMYSGPEFQVMIFKSTIFKFQKGLGNIPTKTTQTTMKLISKQARKAYVSGTLMEKKKKWSDFGKIFRWLLMSSTSVVS